MMTTIIGYIVILIAAFCWPVIGWIMAICFFGVGFPAFFTGNFETAVFCILYGSALIYMVKQGEESRKQEQAARSHLSGSGDVYTGRIKGLVRTDSGEDVLEKDIKEGCSGIFTVAGSDKQYWRDSCGDLHEITHD